MAAATTVFNIPELLEIILLHLPCDSTYEEVSSTRTIWLCRTTCRVWHELIHNSTPLRQRLYLTTPPDAKDTNVFANDSVFAPSRPNPWTPNLLLSQRSWGSAYPFGDVLLPFNGISPSEPRHWTFHFELSRAQYTRLPPSGPWRAMLVCSPPFTDFWYSRCFYELGSGRAPFVTHLDYNPKLPKAQQKYRVHCPDGVTLGIVVDAASDLFEKHANAKFVMIESLPECGSNKSTRTVEQVKPMGNTVVT